MKAFVHKRVDGVDRLGTGIDAGWVTNEYKSLKNLILFAFKGMPVGTYHVEAFNSWENRYGTADYDFIYEVTHA